MFVLNRLAEVLDHDPEEAKDCAGCGGHVHNPFIHAKMKTFQSEQVQHDRSGNMFEEVIECNSANQFLSWIDTIMSHPQSEEGLQTSKNMFRFVYNAFSPQYTSRQLSSSLAQEEKENRDNMQSWAEEISPTLCKAISMLKASFHKDITSYFVAAATLLAKQPEWLSCFQASDELIQSLFAFFIPEIPGKTVRDPSKPSTKQYRSNQDADDQAIQEEIRHRLVEKNIHSVAPIDQTALDAAEDDSNGDSSSDEDQNDKSNNDDDPDDHVLDLPSGTINHQQWISPFLPPELDPRTVRMNQRPEHNIWHLQMPKHFFLSLVADTLSKICTVEVLSRLTSMREASCAVALFIQCIPIVRFREGIEAKEREKGESKAKKWQYDRGMQTTGFQSSMTSGEGDAKEKTDGKAKEIEEREKNKNKKKKKQRARHDTVMLCEVCEACEANVWCKLCNMHLCTANDCDKELHEQKNRRIGHYRAKYGDMTQKELEIAKNYGDAGVDSGIESPFLFPLLSQQLLNLLLRFSASRQFRVMLWKIRPLRKRMQVTRDMANNEFVQLVEDGTDSIRRGLEEAIASILLLESSSARNLRTAATTLLVNMFDREEEEAEGILSYPFSFDQIKNAGLIPVATRLLKLGNRYYSLPQEEKEKEDSLPGVPEDKLSLQCLLCCVIILGEIARMPDPDVLEYGGDRSICKYACYSVYISGGIPALLPYILDRQSQFPMALREQACGVLYHVLQNCKQACDFINFHSSALSKLTQLAGGQVNSPSSSSSSGTNDQQTTSSLQAYAQCISEMLDTARTTRFKQATNAKNRAVPIKNLYSDTKGGSARHEQDHSKSDANGEDDDDNDNDRNDDTKLNSDSNAENTKSPGVSALSANHPAMIQFRVATKYMEWTKVEGLTDPHLVAFHGRYLAQEQTVAEIDDDDDNDDEIPLGEYSGIVTVYPDEAEKRRLMAMAPAVAAAVPFETLTKQCQAFISGPFSESKKKRKTRKKKKKRDQSVENSELRAVDDSIARALLDMACIQTQHAMLQECEHCGKANFNKLLRCSQCHAVRYCDRSCQQLDWKTHKKKCLKQKKEGMKIESRFPNYIQQWMNHV